MRLTLCPRTILRESGLWRRGPLPFSLNRRDKVNCNVRSDTCEDQPDLDGNGKHDSIEGVLQTKRSNVEKRLGSVASRCMGVGDRDMSV